jgi:hypothetical protein
MFVTAQGDTMNKLDREGYYEGLHLYSDNSKGVYSDTSRYILGRFKHGLPVGNWVEHRADGGYSIGQYDSGGGLISDDGKGGWVVKKQGIYEKTGVWNCYNKDSVLLISERYDNHKYKKGWSRRTYRANNAGVFILIHSRIVLRYNSIFSTEQERHYLSNGVLVSSDIENFWRNVSSEYYDNGKLERRVKCRKFFGIKINRSVTRSYDSDGRCIKKEKGPCWIKTINPHF